MRHWIKNGMCLAALALFNGLHLGCAGIAARAAQRSTPPLISESLRTLNEPESRQLIGQIMTMPEVKEGTRQLAASLTSGVLSELTAEERQQRVQQAAQAFVESTTAALIRAFGREFGPALGLALSRAMNDVVATGLTDDNRARLELASSELSGAFGRGLAQTLRTDIGPAIHDMLVQDIGPAMREVMTKDVQGSLQSSAQEIAYGATIGIDQAGRMLASQTPQGEQGRLVNRMSRLAARGSSLSTILLIGLPLLLLWIMVWLFWIRPWIRRRRARRQPPATSMPPEVVQALQEIFKNPESARAFAEALRKREEERPVH